MTHRRGYFRRRHVGLGSGKFAGLRRQEVACVPLRTDRVSAFDSPPHCGKTTGRLCYIGSGNGACRVLGRRESSLAVRYGRCRSSRKRGCQLGLSQSPRRWAVMLVRGWKSRTGKSGTRRGRNGARYGRGLRRQWCGHRRTGRSQAGRGNALRAGGRHDHKNMLAAFAAKLRSFGSQLGLVELEPGRTVGTLNNHRQTFPVFSLPIGKGRFPGRTTLTPCAP